MKILKQKKGFVLVLALLLTLVSLGLIASFSFMMNTGSSVSLYEKIYNGALESAKGAADYIIKQMEWDNNNDILTCDGGNVCKKGSSIDLGEYSSIGDYNIQAIMLADPFEREEEIGDGVFAYYTIYSFRVIAKYKKDPNKKAIIEVVYEIEE